ncbi:TetR/AcrR family transcriptional regulator [Xanthomonas medicagonis]|uniref:TetR/AcrR family transcriptional regulator n=1 Tax=Xanthomonas medicagonis TaxID=3160841 RepID=UPI003511F7D8
MARGGRAGPRRRAGSAFVARRQAILAAARRLFVEAGFDTTSMDAIAVHAGVSKATLYAHFLDKKDLFLCALEETLRQAPDPWQALPSVDGPLRARLAAVAHVLLDVIAGLALDEIRRMLAGCARHAFVRRDVFWELCFERYHLAMQAVLAREVERGELAVPDPAQASRQFFGLIAAGPLLRMRSAALSGAGGDWTHQDVGASVEVFLRIYGAGRACG